MKRTISLLLVTVLMLVTLVVPALAAEAEESTARAGYADCPKCGTAAIYTVQYDVLNYVIVGPDGNYNKNHRHYVGSNYHHYNCTYCGTTTIQEILYDICDYRDGK